ncbi:MAG: hypothetical protein LBT14_03545 [Treponema sp.]|nr:hypothetical protein [Treponema sp.]
MNRVISLEFAIVSRISLLPASCSSIAARMCASWVETVFTPVSMASNRY